MRTLYVYTKDSMLLVLATAFPERGLPRLLACEVVGAFPASFSAGLPRA